MRVAPAVVALLIPLSFVSGAEGDSPIISPLALVAEARAVITELTPIELGARVSQNAVLIDVREPHEYENGHIPGAVNIPRGTLEFAVLDHPMLAELAEANPGKLPDTEIFVYCRSGKRAALAAQTLQSMGFRQVFSLQGGFVAWRKGSHPVEE